MPQDPRRQEDVPMEDRLTQLSDVAVKAMRASPLSRATDKYIVLIDHIGERRGGAATSGYDDDGEALARLTEQARALAATLGITLTFGAERADDDGIELERG